MSQKVNKENLEKIFSMVDTKLKTPTVESVESLFASIGLNEKSAKDITSKYMVRRQLEDTDEETVDEMTAQASVAGYNVPGAFSGKKSRKKKDSDDARIAHGTVSKQIHGKADNINEAKGNIDYINNFSKVTNAMFALQTNIIDLKLLDVIDKSSYRRFNDMVDEYRAVKKIIGTQTKKNKSKLNEVSYRALKNDETRSPRQKIGKTIKEISGKLYRIERAVKQLKKLKTETGVTPDTYWKSTHVKMNKISERILKLARNLREMK